MDYRAAMGVKSSSLGEGVRIAVLDSGVPEPFVLGHVFSDSWVKAYEENPDEHGHATAVSSILFGRSDIHGLCEYSIPIFIKVLDKNGRGSIKSVVNGIYKAIDESADIINLSLGFIRTENCPKDLEKACEAACEAGKTIICAAGNDGGPVNWPAALKTTLCVGAADKNGQKVAFSSSGEVDFVAPGVNLPVFDLNGYVKTVSGTSFATAIVTGLASLLVFRIRSSGNSYTGIEQLRLALKTLAKDVDAPGWDENTGYGLLVGENMNPVDLKINGSIFGTIWKRIITFFTQKRS